MIVSGKKLVFWFYGCMGLLGLAGFAIALYIRSQPIVEREQRSAATLLANAYQKYRLDTKEWPRSPYEAAINFKSENAELGRTVRKGEAEWGLTTTMRDMNTSSPQLVVSFTKPRPMQQVYALRVSK